MQPQDYPPIMLARFWMKVKRDPNTGCWEWTASAPKGYGLFPIKNGGTHQAHRVAYELLVGPIPPGLVLDHLCRNTICVNPDHLEPVTDAENIRRGQGIAAQNAAKTHCIYGHVLSGPNLYVPPRGGRDCVICRRNRSRERAARKKAA